VTKYTNIFGSFWGERGERGTTTLYTSNTINNTVAMVEYYIKLGQKRRAKRKVAANIQRLYRGNKGRRIANKIRQDRNDLLLAKKIQDEEDRIASSMPRRSRKTTRSETADYELARKLQAEESGRKSSRLSAVAKESVEKSDKPASKSTITKQSTTSKRESMPITPSPNKSEDLVDKKKTAEWENEVKIQSKKREIPDQLDDMDIKDELDSMPPHVRKAAENHPSLVVKLISDKKKRREDNDMDTTSREVVGIGKPGDWLDKTEVEEVISIGSSSEESGDESSLLQRKLANAKGRGLGLTLR